MDTPKTLKEIKMNFIKEYVMEQGKEDIQWLIDTIETEVDEKDKEGKPIKRNATYIDIRNAFARKYFPDLAPKGTSKKANMMKDTLAELQAALKKK